MLPAGSEDRCLVISAGATWDWVALSYCRGGRSCFTLRKETLAEYTRAMAWTEIPLTIRDAIVGTRALGLRCLRVDAVCILQDSNEDWAAEASKMAKVYQNSPLTLAAARAPSSTARILTKRTSLLLTCRLPWSTTKLEANVVEREHIYPRNRPSDTPDDNPKRWPWSARGGHYKINYLGAPSFTETGGCFGDVLLCTLTRQVTV